MNEPARSFEAKPATRADEPLLIGMVGPPGGGKTFSSLRLAVGMQAVRGGDIVVVDTEGGRARKYSDQFKFMHVDFQPPHRPDTFLDAIRSQLSRKPAVIIVDSMSDEHEGQGGYLEWHDEMVPRSGNNEWAAWAKPKAARKRLINGLLHIRVPLIFTFRAREKTQQRKKDNGRTEIVNIGWMPVAPLEIVHSLDLTCILPPRADGVPVWKSTQIGEDFIIKLPAFLKPLIDDGALNENTGRALAQWALGQTSPRSTEAEKARVEPEAAATPPCDQEAAASVARETAEQYCARWRAIIDAATNAAQLHKSWGSDKAARNRINWPDDDTFDKLKADVTKAIEFLKRDAPAGGAIPK